MSRDLPADRELALTAIAEGWGRTPSHAHPLCLCGKPYLPTCPLCLAKANQPCRIGAWMEHDLEKASGRHFARPPQREAIARDCPMHRPRKDQR